jgi:hypothetical protein
MTSDEEMVSRECFRGRPLPVELSRLWQARNANDPVFASLGLELLTSPDAITALVGDDAPSDAAVRANQLALRRVFEWMAFFAKCEDGALLAYFQPDEAKDSSSFSGRRSARRSSRTSRHVATALLPSRLTHRGRIRISALRPNSSRTHRGCTPGSTPKNRDGRSRSQGAR